MNGVPEPEPLPTLEPIECSYREPPRPIAVVTPPRNNSNEESSFVSPFPANGETDDKTPAAASSRIVSSLRQLTRDILSEPTLDRVHNNNNNNQDAPLYMVELVNAVSALQHQRDLHSQEAVSLLSDWHDSQNEVQYWKQRALALQVEKVHWLQHQAALQQSHRELQRQRKLLKSAYKTLQSKLNERTYVTNAVLWHEEHLKESRSRAATETTVEECFFETVVEQQTNSSSDSSSSSSNNHSDSLSPPKRGKLRRPFVVRRKNNNNNKRNNHCDSKKKSAASSSSSPLIDLVSVDSDLSQSPKAVVRVTDDDWLEPEVVQTLSIPQPQEQ